jgi:hypothetical protein
MRSLAEEAQQFLDVGAKRPEPALSDFLRPLVQHMESLGRAVTENTMAVMRIEETVAAQSNLTTLPRLINSLHEDLENRNGVNQKLFDALYEELRGYKDGFLLEVFHRPLIRDLITLYDDLSEIHRRAASFLDRVTPVSETTDIHVAGDQMKHLATNLHHAVDSVVEILARMDVRRLDPGSGKLDKLNQRVLNTEPASTPADDLTVSASLKPGFLWRERTIRPEEVTVKKWRPEQSGPASQAGESVSQ